jgi:hypothetical protein
MSDDREFEVVVSAGSLRSEHGVVMAHRWTPEGVVVETEFTGAHLYHLAAAGCILNDLYREAGDLGLAIDGVRVRAYGGFNASTWASTGIEYEVAVASSATDEEIAQLIGTVDELAEIPKALRAGTTVVRRIT